LPCGGFKREPEGKRREASSRPDQKETGKKTMKFHKGKDLLPLSGKEREKGNGVDPRRKKKKAPSSFGSSKKKKKGRRRKKKKTNCLVNAI